MVKTFGISEEKIEVVGHYSVLFRSIFQHWRLNDDQNDFSAERYVLSTRPEKF